MTEDSSVSLAIPSAINEGLIVTKESTLMLDPALRERPVSQWIFLKPKSYAAFAVADLDGMKPWLLFQEYPVQISFSGRAALFTQDPDK